MIFIADLIACSTCFGHHYAHHHGLESIIQVGAACRIWCFGFQVVGMVWSWGLCVRFAGCSSTQPSAPHHTDNLKTKTPNTTGCNHLYNTLELLMMGIMVPETCWASNKICNKNHLLQLGGILFPHINEDARSKPHQIRLKSLASSTCSSDISSIKLKMNMEHRWNDNDWGKEKYSQKNLSQRHFVHRKSHPSDPGTNAGLRGVPAKQHARMQFQPHRKHNATAQGCLG